MIACASNALEASVPGEPQTYFTRSKRQGLPLSTLYGRGLVLLQTVECRTFNHYKIRPRDFLYQRRFRDITHPRCAYGEGRHTVIHELMKCRRFLASAVQSKFERVLSSPKSIPKQLPRSIDFDCVLCITILILVA